MLASFLFVLVISWSCRCVHTKKLDSTIYYLLTYLLLPTTFLLDYLLTSCCFHLPTTTGDFHFRHLVAWLVPVRTQSQAPVSRFNVSSPITGGGHITLQTPPHPKEMCFHWDKRPIQSMGSLQSWGSKWTPDPLPAAIGSTGFPSAHNLNPRFPDLCFLTARSSVCQVNITLPVVPPRRPFFLQLFSRPKVSLLTSRGSDKPIFSLRRKKQPQRFVFHRKPQGWLPDFPSSKYWVGLSCYSLTRRLNLDHRLAGQTIASGISLDKIMVSLWSCILGCTGK